MKNRVLKLFYLAVVLLLSFAIIRPFLSDSYFPMHDDTQPARVYQMAKALSLGQFPVRWVPDLGYGYGYPLFNFYAPLPYYIGALFNLVGFDVIWATKIMIILGILLAGVSMFFLVSEISGDIAAVVSAILYMYAPYHAVNIYIRGAVGEIYTYGLLPLLLLGIYSISTTRGNIANSSKIKNSFLIASMSFAAILLSHNIVGLIAALFYILGLILYLFFFILSRKSENRLPFYVSIFLIGIGLSAFFILPALVESRYTRVSDLIKGGSDFRNHFVYADQLWDSPWGYAGSAQGREDGMSFKIGKFNLILGLLTLSLLYILYKRKGIDANHLSLITYLLSLFILSIFMMLEISKSIWEKVPFLAYIQYPWRFLNFTLLALCVLNGLSFKYVNKSTQAVAATTIVVIALFINIKYFVPRVYLESNPADYISGHNLKYKISKISDEYLPPEFKIPQLPSEIARQSIENKDNFTIAQQEFDLPTIKIYQVVASQPTKLLTNISFFPGWQSYIDDRSTNISNHLGRIEVEIPQGRHTLTFKLINTPVRLAGNTVSLLSFILLVYVSLFWSSILIWIKKPQWKL